MSNTLICPDALLDDDGDRVDTSCMCDADRACTFPACAQDRAAEYRRWERRYRLAHPTPAIDRSEWMAVYEGDLGKQLAYDTHH